jgi:hypothetical protein
MRYALAVGLIAVAAAAAGCASADPGRSAARATGAPDAAARAAIRGLGLRVLASSQSHVLKRGSVAVRVTSHRKTRVRVRLAITAVETIPGRQPGPQKTLTRSRRVALAPGRHRTVRLRLTQRGAAAVTTCARYSLGVWARTGASRAAAIVAPRAERLDSERCQRFFAPTSVWNQPLAADAPLDPQSPRLVAALRQQVATAVGRKYWPTVNTTQYSTPVYEVPENQPRVAVTLDDGATYRQTLREALRAVPIPPGAQAAAGSDQHMVIWQPSTDTMWEFWKMHPVGGTWHAKSAGEMKDVSANAGYFTYPQGSPWGATATSLPLLGGLMLPNELAHRHIDHALAMAIPRPRASLWSLPAQRTDGWVRDAGAVPEGTRFRLDPTVDVASLGLPPALAAMALAAQRYGIIVRDTSATPSFYAEDPLSLGGNPYPDIFGHQAIGPLLARFPWDRLQALKLDLRTYGGAPKSG